MRSFLYKAIIVTIAFILIFEFTVGRKINEFSQVGEKFLTKEGRKDMIVTVKNEMRKAQDMAAGIKRVDGETECEELEH